MTIKLRPICFNDPVERALTLAYRSDADHLDGTAMLERINPEQHFEYVNRRLSQNPGNVSFAIRGDEIVGQFEGGPMTNFPDIGYINFLYVRPDLRGQNLGSSILALAEIHLCRTGFETARLSSVAAMEKNIRFYQKNGWQIVGPRTDKPHMILWEKKLTNA